MGTSQSSHMYKLSHFLGNDWVEHSFAPVFSIDNKRIIGGVPSGDSSIFEQLISCMSEPIALLYVLHTPRGEAAAGRYQSPELNRRDVVSFIEKYKGFLAGDSRFDIWAHSREDLATVVWDRHNKFFAYGPVEKFAAQLRAMGFQERFMEPLGEHLHHYRSEFDSLAAALIREYEWIYSPLHVEDEQ
jgi:hypothetical protein